MPNVKKAAKDKTSYRRVITLTPPVARRVEQMARDEQRPVAAMMRLLVERALEQTEVSR
jgi:hypothetical protein